MAQRYSNPVPRHRMAQGRCPECGGNPQDHSPDPRFWVPGHAKCLLTLAGVEDRIEQYRQDQEASE